MFTYRGPALSALLGPARAPLLAVISVPGLPENRPGLITGDNKRLCVYDAFADTSHTGSAMPGNGMLVWPTVM